MSPLNRGPLLGPRIPPAGLRHPPPPRFGGRLPPPGLPPRMPPPPINPVFGPMRQRLLPPPPPRPGGVSRPGGPLPLFGPRGRGMAPLVPPMVPRGTGPRGPLMRPWSRRVLPPQMLPHMRARFSIGNGNIKGKAMNNLKKVNKLEELELKKPWMTDEIRNEIQKKNKLYAKAKKNKDAKEWEEFKDLRNKVTRMIRDAKNEYLAKHPEQGGQKTDDKNTIESEGVQKTEIATEQSEQMELMEETQPSSKQAHLYPDDEENEDLRDENCVSSEDDTSYYCEICDRDFPSDDSLSEHKSTHKLCGIDGCTFSAHPLLVEKHITMQHTTGLYQRMKNLSTPEDIEKWIMERKKRYPTKANIELKKAEELEKVQRGEIIKQSHNVPQTKRKKVTNIREKRRKPRKRIQILHENLSHLKEVYRGLPAFCGTMSLQNTDSNVESLDDNTVNKNILEENMNKISDEEDIPSIPLKPMVTNLQVSGLVANYGSDSEDEAPEEMPFKIVRTVNTEGSSETINGTVFAEVPVTGQLGIGTQKRSNQKSENSQKSQGTQRTECNTIVNERNQIRSKKHPERLQLLQKLLSRSIQHERNLICQCVKYIVDNNFFD